MAVIYYFDRYIFVHAIYLFLIVIVFGKEIIIPFAYNSSESGLCHISHRNLIGLYLVVVLCTCLNHSSQLYFSLLRSTVIGGIIR